MQNYINSRIIYSIVFYILLMILIYTSKASFMFEENGDIKPFGLGIDKTMFSFGVFAVVLAVISFYLFCIIDVIFPK